MRALLGDIGGTNARFALLDGESLGPFAVLAVAEYPDVEAAIGAFLRTSGTAAPVERAVLAVAGPVEHDRCRMTNSGWEIDAARLRRTFGFAGAIVVNDFEAVAWSLPHLMPADLRRVGGGAPLLGAPLAVLGPGTGLGMAGFLPQDGGAVMASEGGHATYPPADEAELEIVRRLRARFDHVSIERVLSGKGLKNLYEAMAGMAGETAPPRSAAEITAAGTDGSSLLCAEVLNRFCAVLGNVAGNLALTYGARGGVFIAGGIVPRFVDLLPRTRFRERFEAKGRFRAYLAPIPVQVIVHPEPAFVGLRHLARRAEDGASSR